MCQTWPLFLYNTYIYRHEIFVLFAQDQNLQSYFLARYQLDIFFYIYLHFLSFLDEHGFLKRIWSTKKVQCFTGNISVSSVYTTWLRSDLAKWFNLWLKMLYALYLYIIYYRKYLKYRYLGSFDVNCQRFHEMTLLLTKWPHWVTINELTEYISFISMHI